MREETAEQKTKLRSGYTTGCCATATSLAAATLLLAEHRNLSTVIELPRGQVVSFDLKSCEQLNTTQARASIIKDAGDDPDATHGATVFAEVHLSSQTGIRFHAAEGVGTVTKEGLSIAVGEPAINPVPRKMMLEHLSALIDDTHYEGGLDVHIGVEDGERIALKTMNGRLGIVGGLSILGTTGIVRPFSCAAYIASIHQSIDVAHANGFSHIAASTGSTSEAYIKQRLDLPDSALVEMGDFVGAVFKHLRKVPMSKLSLCGGFGKMSKLAAGARSLHSHDSSIDFNFLAEQAEILGANNKVMQQIKEANTSLQALDIAQNNDLPLGDSISQLARQQALSATKQALQIDVYCINKTGNCIGTALG